MYTSEHLLVPLHTNGWVSSCHDDVDRYGSFLHFGWLGGMDGRPNQKLTLPSSHSVFIRTQQHGRRVTPRSCLRIGYPNLSIPGTRSIFSNWRFHTTPGPALRTLSLHRGVKAFRKVQALTGNSSALRRSGHKTSRRNGAYGVQEAMRNVVST